MSKLTAAMNEILAANVRTLRNRIGLEQDAFADEMDVSQASISRWEKGTEPKGEKLARLADMAGCTVAEFTTQLLTAKPRAGELRTPIMNSSALLLPVTLPNEDALTDMFAGLLDPLKSEKNFDVLARRLAQRLPVALAQTVSRATKLAADHIVPFQELDAAAQSKASSERSN